MAVDRISAGDRAQSLRQAANRIQQTLLALETWDARFSGAAAQSPERQADRRALLQVAADSVWCYLVQRELNSVHTDPQQLLDEFAVPTDVRRALGVMPPPD